LALAHCRKRDLLSLQTTEVLDSGLRVKLRVKL